MRMLLAVVVLALGCGGSASKNERKSCERAVKLCDYDEGMDTCVKDIKELKEVMGDSYGKFLDCSVGAKTCGEYVGCAVGGVGVEGLKQVDGLRRGMEKMMGDKMGDEMSRMRDQTRDSIRRMGEDRDGPMPAECKRASAVCSVDDADFAADRCRDMMGNVKADAPNRTKYASCLAAAKNCYAFKDCRDQLWFELN